MYLCRDTHNFSITLARGSAEHHVDLLLLIRLGKTMVGIVSLFKVLPVSVSVADQSQTSSGCTVFRVVQDLDVLIVVFIDVVLANKIIIVYFSFLLLI